MKTNIDIRNEALRSIDDENRDKENTKKNDKLLNILTLIVIVYPIIPLTLLSVMTIGTIVFQVVIQFFQKGFDWSTHVSNVAEVGLPVIWLFGGIAGFYGLVRILFSNRNKASLLLIIYWAFSYVAVTGLLTVMSLRHPSGLSLLHAAYIAASYIIIGIQIYITYKSVKHDKKIKQESFIDAGDAGNVREV